MGFYLALGIGVPGETKSFEAAQKTARQSVANGIFGDERVADTTAFIQRELYHHFALALGVVDQRVGVACQQRSLSAPKILMDVFGIEFSF